MANLSTLFPLSTFIALSATDQIYVYNTSITSVSNGGRCCLWTVPSGIRWAKFEVWGGGSSGPGGCCCQQPTQTGGAGAYARKTITVISGDTYRICAAGSTGCSSTCCGTEGFPSYVQTESATNTINLCARGGPTSCGNCFMFSGTGNCCGYTRVCHCDSFCGEDFGLPAISGASMVTTCGYNSWQYAPQGPYIGGGVRISRDYCVTGSGCQSIGNFAVWPGGGGGGAQTASGNCCWGNHGAGGLVVITYG
jgi:hypothetical protein